MSTSVVKQLLCRIEEEHNLLWAIALDEWLNSIVSHTVAQHGGASLDGLDYFVREFRNRHHDALKYVNKEVLPPIILKSREGANDGCTDFQELVEYNWNESISDIKKQFEDYLEVYSAKFLVKNALKEFVRVLDFQKLTLSEIALSSIHELVTCLPSPCHILLADSNIGDIGANILSSTLIPRIPLRPSYPAEWLKSGHRFNSPNYSSFILLRILNHSSCPNFSPKVLLDLRCNGFSQDGFVQVIDSIVEVCNSKSQRGLPPRSGIVALDLGNIPFSQVERARPNTMGNRGAKSLVKLLQIDPSLRALGLSQVGTSGFDTLINGCPWRSPNSGLWELDLAWNRLSEAHLTTLLRSLLLKEGENDDQNYVTAFAPSRTRNTSYKTSKMCSSKVSLSKKSNLNNARGLRSLNLSHNPFKASTTCEALCSFIAQCPSLVSLDLSSCGISPSTHAGKDSPTVVLSAISTSLRIPRASTSRITEEVAKHASLDSISTYSFFTQFAAALTSVHSRLKTLNLNDNPLTAVGLGSLTAALPYSRLEVLHLRNCRISLMGSPNARSKGSSSSSATHIHSTQRTPSSGVARAAGIENDNGFSHLDLVPITISSTVSRDNTGPPKGRTSIVLPERIENHPSSIKNLPSSIATKGLVPQQHVLVEASTPKSHVGNSISTSSLAMSKGLETGEVAQSQPWEAIADYITEGNSSSISSDVLTDAFKNFCFALTQAPCISTLSLSCNELGDVGCAMIATSLIHGPTNPLFAKVREALEEQTLVNAARAEALAAVLPESDEERKSMEPGWNQDEAPNEMSSIQLMMTRGPLSRLHPVHSYLQSSVHPAQFFKKEKLRQKPTEKSSIEKPEISYEFINAIGPCDDSEEIDIETTLALSKSMTDHRQSISYFVSDHEISRRRFSAALTQILFEGSMKSDLSSEAALAETTLQTCDEVAISDSEDEDCFFGLDSDTTKSDTLRSEVLDELDSKPNCDKTSRMCGFDLPFNSSLQPVFRSGITRLSLSKIGAGDLGAKAFSPLITGRTTLQYLDLSANFISTSIVDAWASAKSQHTSYADSSQVSRDLLRSDASFTRSLLTKEIANLPASISKREVESLYMNKIKVSVKVSPIIASYISKMPQIAKFLSFLQELAPPIAPALAPKNASQIGIRGAASRVHALNTLLGWLSIDEYLGTPVYDDDYSGLPPSPKNQLQKHASSYFRTLHGIAFSHVQSSAETPNNGISPSSPYPLLKSPREQEKNEIEMVEEEEKMPLTRSRLIMERTKALVVRLCATRADSEIFKLKMVHLSENASGFASTNRFHQQYTESAVKGELHRLRELRNGAEIIQRSQEIYMSELVRTLRKRKIRISNLLKYEESFKRDLEQLKESTAQKQQELRNQLHILQNRYSELKNDLDRVWDSAQANSTKDSTKDALDELEGPLPSALQELTAIERKAFISLGEEKWFELISVARSLESTKSEHSQTLTELKLKSAELDKHRSEAEAVRLAKFRELQNAKAERDAAARVLLESIRNLDSWQMWGIRACVAISAMPRDTLHSKFEAVRGAILTPNPTFFFNPRSSSGLLHDYSIIPPPRFVFANRGGLEGKKSRVGIDIHSMTSKSLEYFRHVTENPTSFEGSAELFRFLHEIAAATRGMLKRYIRMRAQKRNYLRCLAFKKIYSATRISSSQKTQGKPSPSKPGRSSPMAPLTPVTISLGFENSDLVLSAANAASSCITYPSFLLALSMVIGRVIGLRQPGLEINDSQSVHLNSAIRGLEQVEPQSLTQTSSNNGVNKALPYTSHDKQLLNPVFCRAYAPQAAAAIGITSHIITPKSKKSNQTMLQSKQLNGNGNPGLPSFILSLLSNAPELMELGVGKAIYLPTALLNEHTISISAANIHLRSDILNVSLSESDAIGSLKEGEMAKEFIQKPAKTDPLPPSNISHLSQENNHLQQTQTQTAEQAELQPQLHSDWMPLDCFLEGFRRLLVKMMIQSSPNIPNVGSMTAFDSAIYPLDEGFPSYDKVAIEKLSSFNTASSSPSYPKPQKIRTSLASGLNASTSKLSLLSLIATMKKLNEPIFSAPSDRRTHQTAKVNHSQIDKEVDDLEDQAILTLLEMPEMHKFFVNATSLILIATAKRSIVTSDQESNSRPPSTAASRPNSRSGNEVHVNALDASDNDQDFAKRATHDILRIISTVPTPFVAPRTLLSQNVAPLVKNDKQFMSGETSLEDDIEKMVRISGTQLRLSSKVTLPAVHEATSILAARSWLRTASVCRPRPSQSVSLFVDVVVSPKQMSDQIVMRTIEDKEEFEHEGSNKAELLYAVSHMPRIMSTSPTKLDLSLPIAVLFAQHRFATGGTLLVKFKGDHSTPIQAGVSDDGRMESFEMFQNIWSALYDVASCRSMRNHRRVISDLHHAEELCNEVIKRREESVSDHASLREWNFEADSFAIKNMQYLQSQTDTIKSAPIFNRDSFIMINSGEPNTKKTKDSAQSEIMDAENKRYKTARSILIGPKAIPIHATRLWPAGLAGRVNLILPKDAGFVSHNRSDQDAVLGGIFKGEQGDLVCGWGVPHKPVEKQTLPPLPSFVQPDDGQSCDNDDESELCHSDPQSDNIKLTVKENESYQPASSVLIPFLKARFAMLHGSESEIPEIDAIYYIPSPAVSSIDAQDVSPSPDTCLKALLPGPPLGNILQEFKDSSSEEVGESTWQEEEEVSEKLASASELYPPADAPSSISTTSLICLSNARFDRSSAIGLLPTPTVLESQTKVSKEAVVDKSTQVTIFKASSAHDNSFTIKCLKPQEILQNIHLLHQTVERALLTRSNRAKVVINSASVVPALWARISGEDANFSDNVKHVGCNYLDYFSHEGEWVSRSLSSLEPNQHVPYSTLAEALPSNSSLFISHLKQLLTSLGTQATIPTSAEANWDSSFELASLHLYQKKPQFQICIPKDLLVNSDDSKYLTDTSTVFQAISCNPTLLKNHFPLLTAFTVMKAYTEELPPALNVKNAKKNNAPIDETKFGGLTLYNTLESSKKESNPPALLFSGIEKSISHILLSEMYLQEDILNRLSLPGSLDLVAKQKQKDRELLERKRQREERDRALQSERERALEALNNEGDVTDVTSSADPVRRRTNSQTNPDTRAQRGSVSLKVTTSASTDELHDNLEPETPTTRSDSDSSENEDDALDQSIGSDTLDSTSANLDDHEKTQSHVHLEKSLHNKPSQQKAKSVEVVRARSEAARAAQQDAALQAEQEREAEKNRRLEMLAVERDKRNQESRKKKLERELRQAERMQRLKDEAREQELKVAQKLDRNLKRAARMRQSGADGSPLKGDEADELEAIELEEERKREAAQIRRRELLSKRAAERKVHTPNDNSHQVDFELLSSDSRANKDSLSNHGVTNKAKRTSRLNMKKESQPNPDFNHGTGTDFSLEDESGDEGTGKYRRRKARQIAESSDRLYRTPTLSLIDSVKSIQDEKKKQEIQAEKRLKAKQNQRIIAETTSSLSERSARTSSGPWMRLSMDIIPSERTCKTTDQVDLKNGAKLKNNDSSIVLLNTLAASNSTFLKESNPVDERNLVSGNEFDTVEKLYRAHLLSPRDTANLASSRTRNAPFSDSVAHIYDVSDDLVSGKSTNITTEADLRDWFPSLNVDPIKNTEDCKPVTSNDLKEKYGVTLLSKPPGYAQVHSVTSRDERSQVESSLRRLPPVPTSKELHKQGQLAKAHSNALRNEHSRLLGDLYSSLGIQQNFVADTNALDQRDLNKTIDAYLDKRISDSSSVIHPLHTSRAEKLKALVDETAMAMLLMQLNDSNARNVSFGGSKKDKSESDVTREGNSELNTNKADDSHPATDLPLQVSGSQPADLSTPPSLLLHTTQTRRYGRSFQHMDLSISTKDFLPITRASRGGPLGQAGAGITKHSI